MHVDPLRSVQTVVTRRVRDGGAVLNAHERVAVDQVMRALTIDAAWQIQTDDPWAAWRWARTPIWRCSPPIHAASEAPLIRGGQP
jgi:hypothetical protein